MQTSRHAGVAVRKCANSAADLQASPLPPTSEESMVRCYRVGGSELGGLDLVDRRLWVCRQRLHVIPGT